MEERERESRKSRFSSPGMPKMYSTPSASRQFTRWSDAVMVISLLVGGFQFSGLEPGGFVGALESAFPWGLDDAVGEHGVCDFDEAGDVCAGFVVDGFAFSGAVFDAFFVDVCHDVLEAFIDFFAAPADAELVLALLEAGDGDAAGVGGFCGAEEDVVCEEDFCGFCGAGHVGAFCDAFAAVFDEGLGVF